MSGGIDPVSQALGRLVADAETRQRQSAELFRLVKETNDKAAEISESVAVVAEKLSAHVAADERGFDKATHDFRNNRLATEGVAAKLGELSAKVDGMELTGAKKAGSAALLVAGTGLFTVMWNALRSMVTGQ